MREGILLINVGSPDSTKISDIRKYLAQFLSDKRVINLPYLARKILVNGIIVPFRAPRSRKLYKKLWSKKGSPLIYYTNQLKHKLQIQLGNSYHVYIGMRYGKPALKEALEKIEKDNLKKLIILPLFPQYASATTGTAIDYSLKIIRKWNIIPEIKIVNQFYNNQEYIRVFAKKIEEYLKNNYDHILFSYHGLPLKQVFKSHENTRCSKYKCTEEINEYNQFCYQASCYATTGLLVNALGISKDKYTVCFQSRFAKNWLSPFTDELLVQKAKEGVKKILVVSPSFVTDCLETIVEIGLDYKELFIANGGKELQLVESLNDKDDWVKALELIISD